jgi:hypothetical protein
MMSKLLSQRLKDEVLSMPEYRQGANKIRVRLKDGRIFSSVFVAWGDEIVKVGNSASIPFEAEEIDSVENDL